MKRPRKIRIRGGSGDKSQKQWRYGRRDPANQGVYEWDGNQPWSIIPITAAQQDQFEILENLYPALKGREKQIVKLLFENATNQSEIARVLGMKQPNVVRALRSIAKKILKEMI